MEWNTTKLCLLHLPTSLSLSPVAMVTPLVLADLQSAAGTLSTCLIYATKTHGLKSLPVRRYLVIALVLSHLYTFEISYS